MCWNINYDDNYRTKYNWYKNLLIIVVPNCILKVNCINTTEYQLNNIFYTLDMWFIFLW
jgi:hypothetical protein